MQSGDGFIIGLVVSALVWWLYTALRSRMKETVEAEEPPEILNELEEPPEDEATQLLKDLGYTVLSGKKRVLIHIAVNRRETLHSRLFFDYIAQKDGSYYAVKLAKERMPLERTGSALRERLLVYQLLYPQTAGVLYVNLQGGTVDCYEFELQVANE
ncbi:MULTISPECIES: hypothetical protein [Paenibacillus]|uniref:hypothetical protein n=1 Tax=Paenibacillus TaxID=44249 RepID=UPI0022B89F38|nr:hypothetical protein [Paenibacillus caseinilyticus]MCZ8520632.1 hypothetical protein [Paenibacillus caseinilyticus]